MHAYFHFRLLISSPDELDSFAVGESNPSLPVNSSMSKTKERSRQGEENSQEANGEPQRSKDQEFDKEEGTAFLTVDAPVHPVKEARRWVSLLNIKRARELNTASPPPDLKEHLRTPQKPSQTKMLLSVFLILGLCLVPSQSKPTGERLGSPLLQKCFEEAKKIVDDAYKYSREESLRRVRRDAVKPHDALRLLKQPRGDTRSAVRSADYMAQTLRLVQEKVHRVHKRSLNATDLLTDQDIRELARITGCDARIRNPSCHNTPNINKYRTATSVCNNLKNPRLGASNTPFTRWLPSEYDDGISQPKGWNRTRRFNNFLLPLVRQVSNNILSTTDAGVVNDTEYSHMVTLFGQWNDHDLTFTPFSPSIRSFSKGLNCDESCEQSEPCIPIPIPPRDPRIPSRPDTCIPAFRSAPACGTGYSAFNFGGEPSKREQINSLTAFLDLGQVYGSDEKLALSLRDLTSDAGLLRVNTEFRDNGRELLPFHPLQVQMCATRKRVTNATNAREIQRFLEVQRTMNIYGVHRVLEIQRVQIVQFIRL
ncbi:hypothetical protein CCH79_00000836, partial [Gambusia affinis]